MKITSQTTTKAAAIPFVADLHHSVANDEIGVLGEIRTRMVGFTTRGFDL
jgi:hypothetical protein